MAKSLQFQRLRAIFAPLLDQLHRQGAAGVCYSMRSDDFTQGLGAVNIWLATEFVDAPPFAGTHVLWFLNQMKITPHSVLLAYDAVLTASQDHCTFLTRWIGDLRPVQCVSWPIPNITPPKGGAGQGPLTIAYSQPAAEPAAVYCGSLPANAQDLANLLARHSRITSLMPLRERSCGFYSYDEAVAIMAGSPIHCAPRQGLTAPIASFFVTDDAQFPPPSDAADLAHWRAPHDPAAIAHALAPLQHLPTTKAANPTLMPRNAPPNTGEIHEQTAFFRDRETALAYLAHLPAPPNPAADLDLASPWAGGLGADLPDDRAHLPWSDLSLTVQRLGQHAAGQAQLNDQDQLWLHHIHKILRRYDPNFGLRAATCAEILPNPWPRIAHESAELRRDYLALSRAVNGHNLYRFSHAMTAPPVKAPILPQGQTDPRAMLAQTGIFLHGYYVDIAMQILQHLKGLLAGCPLFIATDSAEKQAKLISALQQMGWANFRVDRVANRGRDIFSKLVHFAPDHAQFPFVLHLHTKKSPHSSNLAAWGGDMVDALAKDHAKLSQIAHAFAQDAKLGMIYANPPKALHPALRWTRNLRLAERAAVQLGLPNLPSDANLDFPAGSMFWARRDALAPLLQPSLTAQHFAPEQGQEDGTLAHAYERLLGVVCHQQGYHLARSRAQ